jgi:hypothetical protein
MIDVTIACGPMFHLLTRSPGMQSRCIPDRAGVGSLLQADRRALRYFDPKPRGVISRPARRGNLKHPGVVKRCYLRVEIGVLPHGLEFSRANRIGPGSCLCIDGIANGRQVAIARQFTGIGIAPDNIKDLLLRLAAAIQPAFDNLDTIEVTALGIFHGRHQKAGGPAPGSGRQIAAHRYPFAIAQSGGLAGTRIGFGEIKATKKTHAYARSGSGESFLALHRIKDLATGIFLRPNGHHPRGDGLPTETFEPKFAVGLFGTSDSVQCGIGMIMNSSPFDAL